MSSIFRHFIYTKRERKNKHPLIGRKLWLTIYYSYLLQTQLLHEVDSFLKAIPNVLKYNWETDRPSYKILWNYI